MIQHYKGKSGECDYDSTQFYKGYGNGYLMYHGHEVDGSKITIPQGLVCCDYMFQKTDIETMPKIPEGVRDTFAMFQHCKYLTELVDLPDSIKNAKYMFADCPRLKNASVHLPAKLLYAQNMFDDCLELEQPPSLPVSLKVANCMFRNCKALKTVPPINYHTAAFDGLHMFDSCENLTETYHMDWLLKNSFMVIDGKQLKHDFKDMYKFCYKIKLDLSHKYKNYSDYTMLNKLLAHLALAWEIFDNESFRPLGLSPYNGFLEMWFSTNILNQL